MLKMWSTYAALAFISVSIYMMQGPVGDPVGSIWDTLKLIFGGIAAVAAAFWAYFTWRDKKINEQNLIWNKKIHGLINEMKLSFDKLQEAQEINTRYDIKREARIERLEEKVEAIEKKLE